MESSCSDIINLTSSLIPDYILQQYPSYLEETSLFYI